MPSLLVEIGTEELPLAALDAVYFDLKTAIQQMLEIHRIGFKSICVEATPRRIALFVEDLADRQENRELEFSGPSHEKSYDDMGNPTPALMGFLKSKGAALKDIRIKETPKGRFVVIQKKERGKTSREVIPVLLKDTIQSLPFPKRMRWEKSAFRFPRPIRWIVALLDRKLIPVQLADVKASRQSFGHRFLSPKSFTILKADWSQYQALLKKGQVTLSLAERESVIRKGLQRFNQKTFDEDLVHTTAQLAEDPFLIQASFSSAYLDLPAEVLASCMKKNQKIFACYDAKGRLINRFVAVLNGKRRGLAKIHADYENVLESRLRDARYFYDLDTKTSLEDKLPL
ncbi:MAG TPA: glycine--tRNA ligase subunit beta, partial [bacterium]|nr:glycine--tRNA ligase subunit beta [bacterium]